MADLQILLTEDTVGPPILKVLEKWGYHVVLAENAERAWELLTHTLVDLFLIDWMLPGKSGLELVKQIRSHSSYRDAPIIMISGRAEKKDVVAALSSGVDSYIAKPFTAIQLKEKIDSVWELYLENKTFNEKIQHVVQGQAAFDPKGRNSLVILGEQVNTEQELHNLDRLGIGEYLSTFANAIAQVNAEHSDLDLGYSISTSTGQIIDYLKDVATRDQVRMVMVSPECSGSPVLMARLIREKLKNDVPIFLCCDSARHITPTHKDELVKYEVEVIEKPALGQAQWKDLLYDNVVDTWIALQPERKLTGEDEETIERLKRAMDEE